MFTAAAVCFRNGAVHRAMMTGDGGMLLFVEMGFLSELAVLILEC